MPKYLQPNSDGIVTQPSAYMTEAEGTGLELATHDQQYPCWPDGTPVTDAEIAEIEAQKEQARLATVYAEHAATIGEFAMAWAKTGIESVPDNWQEAITLLKAKYASLTTTEEKLEHMSIQQELITLRFGPLADVWDDVTVILNSQ